MARATLLDQATGRKLAGIENCLEFLSDALKSMADKGLDACDAFGAARILADIAAELNEMIGDEPAKVQP